MAEKTAKNPRGAGRKAKTFDLRIFEELCKIQCTEKEICAVLGMGTDTLVKYVKAEYGMTFKEAREEFSEFGKASLRRIQMNLAKKSPAMAIFLGKNYLDQTDNKEIKIDDADKYFQQIADAISQSDTDTDKVLS